MPQDQRVIDTMLGFPKKDFAVYGFIKNQTRDEGSDHIEFPVEYTFKDVPKDAYRPAMDPVDVTLGEMERFNITKAMVGVNSGYGTTGYDAARKHPDRFITVVDVDPNDIMGCLRMIDERKDEPDQWGCPWIASLTTWRTSPSRTRWDRSSSTRLPPAFSNSDRRTPLPCG